MNKLRIERSPQLVYKDGYKYQLQQPYWVQTPLRPEKYVSNGWVGMDTDGKMIFMPGYAWDGASGAPDMPCTISASLMHDGGYQLMREGMLPQSAKPILDKLMAEMMRTDGMWVLCAEFIYWMVRMCGRRYTVKPTKTITIRTP